MYLPLPDGSSLTVNKGETLDQAWARGIKLYPEAFGLKRLDDSQKFDADYFNSCKLTAAKIATNQLSMLTAIKSCEYMAIPKKCRSHPITTDKLGNEIKAKRTECIVECSRANIYSRKFGECSKGN